MFYWIFEFKIKWNRRYFPLSNSFNFIPIKRKGFWDSFITESCRDGKFRRIPIEPAFFPLANGVPEGMVRLRGYGNAIVPPLAAEFIQACEECLK